MDKYLEEKLLDHIVILLIFKGTSILFFIVSAQPKISLTSFSPHHFQHWVLGVFLWGFFAVISFNNIRTELYISLWFSMNIIMRNRVSALVIDFGCAFL